ncbi:MAG TPA: hypothetical protein VEL06_15320 [Haliangiales bacterium]|nr:hypothetical protein [Haliangiales bacterium]
MNERNRVQTITFVGWLESAAPLQSGLMGKVLSGDRRLLAPLLSCARQEDRYE